MVFIVAGLGLVHSTLYFLLSLWVAMVHRGCCGSPSGWQRRI